ncbi:MAG TPA: AAA family ATPase [Solirubrobacteraceae bacterium]|nr:AAA family ATPase [Solirubrobacteraceae bacterium]
MGARVHLCGRLQLEWDGERLDAGLPGRQGRLLLAFLTLHRDRLVRRDELVEALWPDEIAPSQGDALLRPLLSRLRRALGDPDRLEGRRELAVGFPEDTWVDRESVRDAVRRSGAAYGAGDARAGWDAARDALAIAERGLLPGLEADWLGPFRAELEEQRIQLLETTARAGAQLGHGELPAAEEAARRAVEAAPFRESARVALLDVLRRRGNVAEALVAFDEFRLFLRDELGTPPGRDLIALHEDLLRADLAPAPRASAAAPVEAAPLPDRLMQALAAPWVGRDEELGRLREAAALAATGVTGIVLVAGDGGIGKTRLVAELAAGLTGFDVLYGRCDEAEIFPYGPWVDMLRPRLERMSREELAALPGSAAAALAHLVPELGDRLPADDGRLSGADPETERRLLFAAVTDVLERLAQQRPLLLVIDDLHWADRSSLLLGRHLARRPRLGPVLLLGTVRDTELEPGHPLPDLIADVERDRPVPRVRLAGMDEDEVGELIGSWHGAGVETGAVRAIRAETDGNPFFVKQLVRHLEEVGGEEPLAAHHAPGVPQGVRDVIARRVARLPPRAGEILRVAALIGRDFEFGLLEDVAGVAEDELLDVLDAAVRGALLAEVPSTPGRYSFAHALLRSTMEAELSATRRALLHRRIGEAIEQRHRSRPGPWLDELARHFAAAGPQEVDRAVDYAVRAAEQASARLAFDEAVSMLDRAIGLRRLDDPVDPLELARLETALAAAAAPAGRWEAARAAYARAAAAAREAEAGPSFARAALGHAGGTFEQYGKADAESVALLEEALERLPDGDSRLRSQVLARLSVLLYWGDAASWEQIIGAADTAVAIARRLGDADALGAALTAALFARWRPGRVEERLPLADELIAATEERGALVEAAEARLWRISALLEIGDVDRAEEDLARLAEIADRSQQYQLLILNDSLRAMRALLVGEYAAGAAVAEEMLERGTRAQVHGSEPMPLLSQVYGIARLAVLNERDELGQIAPLAEQMVREIGALPGWRAVLAWTYVQAGRDEEARAQLESLAAADFAALPRDINFLPSMAMVAHALGQLGDAALAARAEPLVAPYADLYVVYGIGSATLGPVAYSLGLLQLLQDRADAAAASFSSAIERSRAMHARPYVARSRAGLAEALRRRGAAGDAEHGAEQHALAVQEAEELGMARLQRELRAC